MKKVFISLAILFSLSATAQNVKVDSKGNYVAISHVKDSANYKESGKTYEDAKGDICKVYVTDKGKMFIKRTSKTTGKEYRYYLHTEAKN